MASIFRDPLFWIPALFAAACILFSSNVFAAPTCLPLESLLEQAQNNYNETLAWTGDVSPEATMMLLQSPHGTWTLIAVHGTMACLVAVGKDGEAVISGQEV